jgi:hypothetical protein
MKLSHLLTLTSAMLATVIAAPIDEATEFGRETTTTTRDLEERAANPSTYTLQIGGGRFDINELQSLSPVLRQHLGVPGPDQVPDLLGAADRIRRPARR